MKSETLYKAAVLAERIAHVFVATASGEGAPHLAAAGKLALKSDSSITWKPGGYDQSPQFHGASTR